MIFSEQEISNLKALTDNASSIVFIPHQNPDGDAIGSILGWWNVFRNRGLHVSIVVPDEVPSNLRWMQGIEDVTVYGHNPAQANEILQKADLFFLLDFNTISRCGEISKIINKTDTPRILIDHHPKPDEGIADVLFSDVTMSSTCELSYYIFEAAGWGKNINREAAGCLYAGIITDTGSLSYNSSNPRTYHAIADLVARGIDKNQIHNDLFQSNSFHRMKLLGHVLCNKLELIEDGRAAFISVSKDEMDKFNYKPGDTEGFVNIPLSIKGVVISAFFSEREKDKFVKLSFRSQADIPVNLYAKEFFSGGGHPNAAGGEWHGTLSDALERLRATLPVFVKKLNK